MLAAIRNQWFINTGIFLLFALGVGGPSEATASSVTLQQATATFSQTYGGNFSIAKTIDGLVSDNGGWAISPGGGPNNYDQIGVFETASDVGFASGSLLTFTLVQNYNGDSTYWYHTLGRFRLSVTTDDRSLFADGLATGGDVTANWTVLDPDSFTSANGATLSELLDHSILASGLSPTTDVYTVTVSTLITGITGVRLEALKDPSLPYNGPGRKTENGNFLLSEFQMSIAPATNCVAGPSGLTHRWPGEGNANDVVGGANGTMQSGATFAAGKVGQAFSFDGVNDSVSFGNTTGNFGTNDFTIEFWIRNTATTYASVIEKWPTCGNASMWAIRIRGPGPWGAAGRLEAFMISDAAGHDVNSIFSGRVVNDGVFHHVAMVREATNLLLYIDGTFEVQGSTPGITRISNTANLVAGQSVCVGVDGTSPFTGQLDELALYNRALSAGEIQAIYDAGSAGKCPPPPPSSCASAPPGLVSWWRAENNAMDSADGNQGSMENGATFAGGEVQQAFSFDGVDDFVNIPDAPNLRFGPTSPMTVDMWVYRTSSKPAQHLIGKRAGCTSSPTEGTFQLVLDMNTGAGLAFGGPSDACACSGQDLPLNTWTHLAGTFDGTTLRLFIDGQLAATTAGLLGLANTAPLRIGDSGTCGADYGGSFGGLIDEVSIYNRALSTNEIQAIYNAGNTGKCVQPPPPTCVFAPSGLVSWWKGEHNALDPVGGNNGTLVDDTTYGPGEAGQAFVLDGNGDGVNVGNAVNLQLQDFTIETWVQRASTSIVTHGSYGNGIIFGYGYGGYGLYLDSSGTPALSQIGLNEVKPGVTITDTNLHHLAVTKSGSSVVFYVDGTAYGAAAYNPGFTFSTGAAIGIRGDNLDNSFLGTIDEVSVYNRALAAKEIQSIYNAGSAGKCVPPLPLTCDPAPSGLVSWWRAEGNALDSAAGNHGTVHGGLFFGPGEVGQAFTFNGSNAFVEVPSSPGLKPTGPFSIEAWVNYDRITAPYGDMIVAKGQDVEGPVDWALSVSPVRKLRPHVKVGASWIYFDCATTLSTGVWYHVSMVYDGSTLRGFVNGVLDGTHAVSGALQATDYSLKIGAYAPVNGTASKNWFAGRIDELSIYNRALSTNEIQAIYNAGSAGKCPPPPPSACAPAHSGLVSWWRAEGNANDAADGNPGAIAGTVTYGPGIVGQAFVFDGTHRDRVNVGNPTNLRLEDFTLEAWVKRSSPTVTSFDVLGADGSVAGDGACIFGYGRGGYIFALANDGRLILSRTDIDGLFSTPLVTDTNWHHLAVTKSGSNAIFYLDGAPQATPAYDHPNPYTFDDGTCTCSATASIGSRGDARGGTFFGMIDEPAVFNRALSAAEIQSIYAAGSVGLCVPPPGANHPPVANPQTVSLNEDATLSITLTGSDADGDALTFTLVSGPTNGILTGTSSNLIYHPYADYFGVDGFRFKVNDGQIDSAPATVTITVVPVNDPPIANSQSVSLNEDTPRTITLVASDVDGDPLTYQVAAPAHGQLSGAAPNLTYTPNPNYFGPDGFTFKVNDGHVDSGVATVSLNVISVNDAPVARATISPLAHFPGDTNLIVIAPNNTNALIVLDGSLSTDVENDPLQYTWWDGTNVIASVVLTTNVLNVGTHIIGLVVSDGMHAGTDSKTLEVITRAQSVGILIHMVTETRILRKNQRPLIESLKLAAAFFDHGRPRTATNQLKTFQNKVRAQVAPFDAALAEQLVNGAQVIIDAMNNP